ncbi:ArsR/SmtB family transcription factor [Bordetella bronchiseptica]|uniref:ArsR/SmtB family transcription factor n=1 Tax=Bordetella bronchiseptica TaxID=518 RepID=UPI0004A16DA1|nr:helix-turn-helix domain-containing protein [Bordetella bronchiseptica]AWQ05412.1 transcriptional regulator [Bordetella bronchiseptica]KDD53143.1 DNA-binding helix-turn-helix protein [Bordetella bronchiseptica OSU553]
MIQESLYYSGMNAEQAVSSLGALAHAQRLSVFRALVVAGPAGLTPSVMADGLGIARNALSFHLKELAHAGLVSVEQQGRNLIYRADFLRMNALLGYLTEHCCQGAPCEVSDSRKNKGGCDAGARRA